MELSALEALLTEESLEEARTPLKRSERKKKFLRAFLMNHCKVVETLNAEEVGPEELLVWRSTDALFDSLYKHYEKLANADLAAAMRYQARNSDDPKVQAAVLASLDPEYSPAVTKERERARLKSPQPEQELATYSMDGPAIIDGKIKDPVAAASSQLLSETDKTVEQLVRETIRNSNTDEFGNFFRERNRD